MTRLEALRSTGTSGGPVPRQIAFAHADALLHYDETRLVLDHWRSLGGQSALPGRRDIDAVELVAALGHIFLMDYLHGEGRLRYRLVGEEVRRRYERALVGEHLDEVVEAEAYPRVGAYFLACPETPAIVILTGRLFHEWQRPGYGERLLLPLFAESGQVEGLLGVTVCKKTFDDQQMAERCTGRRLHVIPLDGSAPNESEG